MATNYISEFSGVHNDKYDERITSLLNAIQSQQETITSLTNRITLLENRPAIFKYTICKLDDDNGGNKTYSNTEMPIIQLYNTNDNLYISNGRIRFYTAERVMIIVTATFYKSSSGVEIWISLYDNNIKLATAIDTNAIWTTLHINTIADVTSSSQLWIQMHDNGIQIHNSGVSNPKQYIRNNYYSYINIKLLRNIYKKNYKE